MAESAAAQSVGAKGEVRIQGPSRAERTVARRSAESRATVPDLELRAEPVVDATLALAQRREVSFDAVLVRACALALTRVPRANGAYRDGRYELYGRVNVGVTITGTETYAVPTIFDADTKPLTALHEEIAELRTRALRGALLPPQLSGATMTVWNPGALGIVSSTPLIIPPQAAAVSAGAPRTIAVNRDGELASATAITVTLAADHRILFGTEAARFLTAIASLLEEAEL
jgi:pyruvate dehydrogenase E2 component (dihydrolipoamide acetyltransferase)